MNENKDIKTKLSTVDDGLTLDDETFDCVHCSNSFSEDRMNLVVDEIGYDVWVCNSCYHNCGYN